MTVNFDEAPKRRRRHRRGRSGRHGRSTKDYARPSKPILRRVSVPRQESMYRQHGYSSRSCPTLDEADVENDGEAYSEAETMSEGSDVSDLFEVEEEQLMMSSEGGGEGGWSDGDDDDEVVRPHDIEVMSINYFPFNYYRAWPYFVS